jgi:FAD/FMN-containing dehydrogenase
MTVTLDLDELRRTFHGTVLAPGDPGWDAGRELWNAMFDRQPLAIAHCTGVADVVEAVRFARRHELPISVRGGGHDAGGKSVLDDTFLIDVGPMDGVLVDPEARTAVVQAGAKWRIVDREAQLHGLAVTGGTVSDTGVAGLTLGGGIGWLMRSGGVTVDSLTAMTAVTAQGEVIRIDRERRPELFWGMLGAGPNFAIVTSFEFVLRPVGPLVTAGMVLYPGTDAASVIRHWRDYMDTAPEAVGSMLLVMRGPDALGPEHGGKLVIGYMVVHTDDGEVAQRELAPLREWGEPIADLVAPVPYVEVQQALEQTWPEQKRFYEKSGYVTSIDDGLVEEMVACFASAPFPAAGSVAYPLISAMPMGGAVDRVADDAMAFPRAECAYWWDVAVLWDNPDDDPGFIAWTRAVYDRLLPYASKGAYINLMVDDGAEPGDWLRSAYGPEKYDRLVALKDEWDPDNLFRGNKNIRPSVRA